MQKNNTLIYVHGLSSSGATASAKNIQENLPDYRIIAPDMPIHPQKALDLLQAVCTKYKPIMVIGTSMGAMLTQQLHGQLKVLINPAFHVSRLMRENIGIQPFLNPRQDGSTHYEITSELCDAYERMEASQFIGITDYDRNNTYGFFGTHDQLVNCQAEFNRFYKHIKMFEGEHRLNPVVIQKELTPYLLAIIAKL